MGMASLTLFSKTLVHAPFFFFPKLYSLSLSDRRLRRPCHRSLPQLRLRPLHHRPRLPFRLQLRRFSRYPRAPLLYYHHLYSWFAFFLPFNQMLHVSSINL
ncbi:hypothetical protein VNO77_17366 [Canavalia gladiata]|uniref:Uncharacterized protein n=1 Tax=Canavalia gladiata TaxID=3824 RepID=A0AAN9LNP5_CANGL